MERSTMLLMGKSTISMAIFNNFLYVYHRYDPCFIGEKPCDLPNFGDMATLALQIANWSWDSGPRPMMDSPLRAKSSDPSPFLSRNIIFVMG